MLKHAAAAVIFCVALCVAAPAQAGLTLFRSPSDNIGCELSGQAVRCDVAEHSWVAPPKPASCEVDWGNGVAVDRKGNAGYVCAGDTALHQGNALAYGSSTTQGRFKCTSKESGMKCVNTKDKHGFFASRDSVRLF